jgi:hypothetical protein
MLESAAGHVTRPPCRWASATVPFLAMDRAARIDLALAKRNYSPVLRERIERLLDGREDRARLRCCNSGCFVCVQELLAILAEVEETVPGGEQAGI